MTVAALFVNYRTGDLFANLVVTILAGPESTNGMSIMFVKKILVWLPSISGGLHYNAITNTFVWVALASWLSERSSTLFFIRKKCQLKKILAIF